MILPNYPGTWSCCLWTSGPQPFPSSVYLASLGAFCLNLSCYFQAQLATGGITCVIPHWPAWTNTIAWHHTYPRIELPPLALPISCNRSTAIALGVWSFQALKSCWCGWCKCLFRAPGSFAFTIWWLTADLNITDYQSPASSATPLTTVNCSSAQPVMQTWLGSHPQHLSLPHVQSITKFCPQSA